MKRSCGPRGRPTHRRVPRRPDNESPSPRTVSRARKIVVTSLVSVGCERRPNRTARPGRGHVTAIDHDLSADDHVRNARRRDRWRLRTSTDR